MEKVLLQIRFLIGVQMRSIFRGYLALDTLMTFIPILLMSVYLLNYANFLSEKSQNELRAQILHNKLVSVGELVVNDLAAKKTNLLEASGANSVKPNWIDENELSNINRDRLAKDIGLVKLNIGWQADGKNCIYRVVAFSEQKDIRQLFICGE